jgi:hypothetical protein
MRPIMKRRLVILAVVAGAIALASCRTEYRSYGERPVTSDTAPIAALDDRRVFYRVARAFYRDPPECVVVLPAPDNRARPAAALRIERAVARHLRDKVPRVIGPLGRDRAVRRLALDLNHAGDRRRFAQIERCDVFVRWRAIGSSNENFLVWSHRDFGLDVEMFRAPDRTLWKASHVARRSDGGVPLSPLSAPIAIFEAARFSNDKDILPSMIDDTLRRLVASLPDVR